MDPEHLERMLVELADPVTGEPLGASPAAGRNAVPVAGFDLTFSPPKSVSVAWALADEGTKAVIDACHRSAVSRTLSWAEDHVFHSRSGHAGVVEEDVTGVIAASFTHWSSRADDPQLHDHVVIWNRARSVGDGRWRTLDSRAIFKATTTLSELHQGVLTDLLTEALGYGWEARSRRHSPRPRYEIDGVPEALMAEFSTRAAAIAEAHRAQLASFRAAHGRAPSAVEAMRLRQTATVATRGAKSHRSLAELTESWRDRADRCVPRTEQVASVSSLAARNDLPRLRRDDLAGPILADAATSVLEAVSEHHATFSAMNVLAESHRVLHGLRFASPDERIAAGEVATNGVFLSDKGSVGVGDEVVTRENNRLLTTGRGFVKNGDRFLVVATHEDGSVVVRRLDGAGEVVLPADYVAHHVELAYATTAHRAQGRTVDTAHAFVSGSATRELLYVSATRGRESNRLYVDLTDDPDPATSHGEGPLSRPGDVLARILGREGAEHSAHEALRRAREEAGSLATLVAEYQTIARVADEEPWGITRDQRPLGGDGVASSLEALAHRRRAEAALLEACHLGARSTHVEENGEIPVMAVEAGGLER